MKVLHICVTGPYTDIFNFQKNLLIKYQAKVSYSICIIVSKMVALKVERWLHITISRTNTFKRDGYLRK